MLISYPILLTRSNKKEITKAWSPDLNKEFNIRGTGKVSGKSEFVILLQEEIQDYINIISKNKKLKRPKKVKDYENITDGEKDLWIKIYVTVPDNIYDGQNNKKGFFSRMLPKVGVGISLIASLCFGIVTLLSFELLAGDKKEAGKITGIFSALLLIVINTVIYLYSNARGDLSSLGDKIDNYILRKRNKDINRAGSNAGKITNTNYELLSYQESQSLITDEPINTSKKIVLNTKGTTALILSKLSLYGCALAVTAIDAVTNSQEVKTLAERAIEEGSIVPEELILTIAITQAITNGITELIVFLSFMNLALKEIESSLNKKYGTKKEDIFEDTNVRNGKVEQANIMPDYQLHYEQEPYVRNQLTK